MKKQEKRGLSLKSLLLKEGTKSYGRMNQNLAGAEDGRSMLQMSPEPASGREQDSEEESRQRKSMRTAKPAWGGLCVDRVAFEGICGWRYWGG